LWKVCLEEVLLVPVTDGDELGTHAAALQIGARVVLGPVRQPVAAALERQPAELASQHHAR